MQIEGFWYDLFLGVLSGDHPLCGSKDLTGPLLFGKRGWCGYACWTAMVLDFSATNNKKPRKEKLGALRCDVRAGSLALVSGLFLMKVANLEQIMFWLFSHRKHSITSQALRWPLYLRIIVRSPNICVPSRYFSNYMSYFRCCASTATRANASIVGGACGGLAPWMWRSTKSRKRKNGTECILCYECAGLAPQKRCTRSRIPAQIPPGMFFSPVLPCSEHLQHRRRSK